MYLLQHSALLRTICLKTSLKVEAKRLRFVNIAVASDSKISHFQTLKSQPRHYYNKSDLTLMISWLKLPMKVQQNCRNVTKLLFLFAYTACRSQSVT